jgi:hypothetical protein
MRAHSEIMTHGTPVGMPVRVSGLDWLQRLRQWFKSFRTSSAAIADVSPYGTWDARREKYQPLKAEAAADLVAAQHGAVWSARIYSLSV